MKRATQRRRWRRNIGMNTYLFSNDNATYRRMEHVSCKCIIFCCSCLNIVCNARVNTFFLFFIISICTHIHFYGKMSTMKYMFNFNVLTNWQTHIWPEYALGLSGNFFFYFSRSDRNNFETIRSFNIRSKENGSRWFDYYFWLWCK